MVEQPIYISQYDYPLPDERIAKYPLAKRDESKLLIYRNNQIEEDKFYNVGQYIPNGSLLVYNNTRVIQARIIFHKESGARIEVFCLNPLSPSDYQLSLSSTEGCTWLCMIGNAKKWKQDTPLAMHIPGKQDLQLFAHKGQQKGNTYEVQFEWNDPTISFAEILEAVGELPIPPYLNRKTEESDKTTYQTVYSRIKGSVAAPTAGLHFTTDVLDGLRARGINTTELTLHVGAGTFQPVKEADANKHTMHTEIIAVPRDTIATIQHHLGLIVAVGTTSMRTLESLYFLGAQLAAQATHCTANNTNPCAEQDEPQNDTILCVGQHDPYNHTYSLSTHDALQALLNYLDRHNLPTLHAATQIMIRPGYTFHVVDQLITNFHQPKSTLLLLVSAFVGGKWQTIYDYALTHDFRFLSYGDSSILTRTK